MTKKSFLMNIRKFIYWLKYYLKSLKKRALRKQEDYDAISLGIPLGRSQSCDVSGDFAV